MRFLRVFIAAAILAICGASCGGNSPVGPEPVTHASYPDAAPSPSPSPSPAS